MDIPGRESREMNRRRKSVLVIDDDQVCLKAIAAMVARLGYTTEATADGFHALHLLENQTFDLVIVDMVMPEIGGLLLTKLIRQQHPRTPILAVSGYYDKVSRAVGAPDIDAILPKPLNLETLRSALYDIFLKTKSTELPLPTA